MNPKSHHDIPLDHLFLTRRRFLQRAGMGMGALGLATLVGSQEGLGGLARAAATPLGGDFVNPMAVKAPQFPAKAKRVIHLFMNGGPSHVDTFDPKPSLDKYHGQALPMENLATERKTGAAYKSPFKFEKYGQSGIEISEIFADLGEVADDLCVIRSMKADVPNHEPSLLLMNCGEARQIRPSMGSWVTYGLGSENQNLPGFIAMCPNGYPIQESQNWQSAFLPAVYQGTYIDTRHEDPDKLIQYIKNNTTSLAAQRRQLDLLMKMNEEHKRERDHDAALEARIQSFEMAYRMQMEATDAFDISREPEAIREMYGPGVQARQLLIARRLLEKGVRYIQVWHGEGQPWDAHDNIEENHRRLAGECSKPIAALIKDLKQRGMLEDTLVIWGGEFGRTPTVELPQAGANAGKINGRDHNSHGFSMWLAGGGCKAGYIHGATDEFGFKAQEKIVHVHDLQATLLNLLGFDHEDLTYRYAGRDFRLTDTSGSVVPDLIG